MVEAGGETTGAGALIISPRGRLDMMSAPALREHLHTEVQRGNTRLVVDLSVVDHIDSAGLSALISGLKAARQAGGSLFITKPSAQVRKILQLTNLHRVLETHDQADEAAP